MQDTSYAQQWAMSCISPSIEHFLERFEGKTKYPLAAFNAARLFSPLFTHYFHLIWCLLKQFHSLLMNLLSSLKHELPMYLTKATTLSSNEDFDMFDWWNRHQAV